MIETKNKRLKNKVCIVTGASSGIGFGIASKYLKEGAKVIATYNQNLNGAKKLKKKFGCEIIKLDVRNKKKIFDTFKSIKKKYKKIDILVNNAGVNKTNDFDKLSEKDWNYVIDVNLKGVFFCCQAACKFLEKKGKVINIGSLSGEYGGPRTPSYAAAKAGVMSLTHCLARFLGKKSISVNCLSPGVIANKFTEKTMSKDVKKIVKNLILLNRLGKVDDLLGAAVFLASDDANYITGQTISVNGGAWVR